MKREVYLLLLFCALVGGQVKAQNTLKGTVLEHGTGIALQGVTVSVAAMNLVTATDDSGKFSLAVPAQNWSDNHELIISSLGFDTVKVWRNTKQKDLLIVEMHRADESLEEVVIFGSSKYKNKDNPAVELIRKVIDNRASNRLSALDFVQYRSYEKVMMAVSNVSKVLASSPLVRKFDFVFENIDTTLSEGRKLLPIYLEEQLSTVYQRKNPGSRNVVPNAKNVTELDKRFVNNENIQTSIQHLQGEFDVYDNTMVLFNRPFMSPLSTGATLFYKYSIRDTVYKDEQTYVLLDFQPRNPEERLFSGNLLISLDGTYAVGAAQLYLDSKANINWINDVTIKFEFFRHFSGRHLPLQLEYRVNFGFLGSRQGMFSQKTVHYDKFKLDTLPDEVFQLDAASAAQQANLKDRKYWELTRPISLSKSESTTIQNIDSLNQNKSFLRMMEWMTFAVTSYKRVGAVDIGPLEYAYSFNELEGSRLRLGGRINRGFTDRFYGDGYLAYGLKDQTWKYYASAAMSLNNRQVNTYPAHYVQLTYQHDNREPGQRLDFLNGDSFFRSFRTSSQEKWLFHTRIGANHVIEFSDHIRLQTSLVQHKQQAAGMLVFQRAGDQSVVPNIRVTELGVDLRWAPGEEYFQRNLLRSPIKNRHPILNLRYQAGIKGLMKGQYDYHALRFDASKRLYLSLLGFSDISTGFGYIFGALPYSLLDIPMANQSFLLSPDSYSMMNDLEFVSDQYFKFSMEHRFEGFFLSKVPLIKKLKLRELMSFKMFYGKLRAENNPLYNPDSFVFPSNSDGQQTTFGFANQPYMEASVGVENILSVLRVEYVRRLSYLHHPDLKSNGFRFSIRIGF